MNKTAVLTLKKNSDLYRHIEGIKYKNLRTGVEWDIEDDKAGEIFSLNVQATLMFNKYPDIENMIEKLGLKYEREE